MIKVLQSRAEIKEAGAFLQKHKLVTHYDELKNWDLALLYDVVQPLPMTIRIADLGCAGLAALNFFHSLGFTDLHGMDLTVTRKERLRQAALMCRSLSLRPPFHLYRRDLTKTEFPDRFCGLVTSISVIEHGVDPVAFFAEMDRIIEPGGLLFVTTDYWPVKMLTRKDERPCGLDYTIFSKEEIINLIGLAGSYRFSLLKNTDIRTISDPLERNILGEIYQHTFICLVFKKTV
jgi:SAM-dependent methyltransferase